MGAEELPLVNLSTKVQKKKALGGRSIAGCKLLWRVYNKNMKKRFYPEKIVKKARALRKEKKSARVIAKELGVSRSTILRWCADIHLEKPFRSFAFELHEQEKKKGADSVKNFNIDEETARLLASLLYWCEGGKYPAGNFVSFCNSDIVLAKTFLQLFRMGFSPDENRIKASLQLHSTQDIEKMFSFWSKALSIPKSQFYKSTITEPTKNMKRRNYMGTCTIRYYDIGLLIRIIGIYESFPEKIISDKVI